MKEKQHGSSTTRLICLLNACLFVFMCSVQATAQASSVPETPILISQDDSTRALIGNVRNINQSNFKPLQTVRSGATFVLFVTNLQDMSQDEGANALRAYAESEKGQEYLLEVEDMQAVSDRPGVYGVRVRMVDKVGAIGDVLVRVTWRGMTTNRVRVGIGRIGGGPADDEGAAPTPMSKVQTSKDSNSRFEINLVTPRYFSNTVRFMQQATFGPTPALEERFRRRGLDINSYLEEQFSMPAPRDFNAAEPLNPFNYPNLPLQNVNRPDTCTGDCQRDNYTMYQMQRWFYRRALYGQDQLRARMSWALLQILVVSNPTIQQPSHMLQYQKLLDRNAFGNYKTLLREVTLSPVMGAYLNMAGSTRTNPNENYPREILQLFSVGLNMLNVTPGSPNYGNPLLDSNNDPIPTYTQATVENLTKVLTGWNLRVDVGTAGVRDFTNSMRYLQANHDKTAKTLLVYPGSANHFQTIAANQCATDDINGNCAELDQALDNIYNHPNVAPFISKNLIQHFVTSDPTPAYLERVSNVFNQYREDPNQLRYVVRAILTDPEARGSVKNDPKYGLLREPVLFITNLLRNFNAKSFSATPLSSPDCNMTPPWGALNTCSDGNINDQSAALGQSVYQSPTVFNYYLPGYVVPASNPPVLGPEFQIYTTSTAFGRVNFINQMFMKNNNGIGTTAAPNTNTPFGTSISLTNLMTEASADPTGGRLVDTLNVMLLQGRMSPQMRTAILTAVTAVPAAQTELRAETALYLVVSSSQYQVQK